MNTDPRKVHPAFAAAILFLTLAMAVPAAADSVPVHGRVVRVDGGAPVAGAVVDLAGAADARRSITDADGRFRLPLPPGEHALRVRAEGFRPLVVRVRVGAEPGPVHDLRLEPAVLRHEEHLVVTASRHEQPAAGSPRSIAVLDREQLEERAPRSTPEALADLPGVLLQKTNHGSGSPYVRGLLGNQVLVLVDGVRLNNGTFRYGPNQYLATIDPGSLDRVEVLRGSGSVLYGSDAIGGVINLVTRRARLSEGPLRVSGGVSGKWMTSGMEQSGRAEAEASSSSVALRGGLSLRRFGDLVAGGSLGTEAPSGYGEVSGDVSGVVRLGRTSLLSVSYQHLHQSDVPRWDQVAQRGFARYAFDPQVRQLASGTWEWFPASGPIARVDAGLSWHHTRERRERQSRGSAVFITEQDTVATWGATASVETRAFRGWTLVAGLDAYRDSIGSWRRDRNQATALEVAKRGLYPDGSRASSVAAFATGSWERGRLHLDVGARFNQYSVSADDGTFGSIDLSPSATVGSVAASYRLGPGLEVVGSVAQSFRAPNVDDVSTLGLFDYGIEVPSPNLSPERALSVEGGLRARSARTAVAATVFRTTLRDLIDRVPSLFAGGAYLEGQRVYQKANVARAFVRGVEAQGEAMVSGSLRVAAHLSYTYGHQPSSGQPMRRIPPLNGLVSLRWSGPGRLWVDGQWRMAAAQRRLAPGDISDHRIGPDGTDGWNVFDVYAGRPLSPRLSLSAGLVNLFDEPYRVHGSGLDGMGRSLWVSLAVKY